MKFLPDSLQSTQFRNYFMGNMLSYHGVQIFIFAESWIVHELNEAPEALGLLGLYASIPILVFNLFYILPKNYDKNLRFFIFGNIFLA